jgi:hypothetical protein
LDLFLILGGEEPLSNSKTEKKKKKEQKILLVCPPSKMDIQNKIMERKVESSLT